MTSNFIAANFELHKTVFDVRQPEESCVNTTNCGLPLAFFSQQHVVLEVASCYTVKLIDQSFLVANNNSRD